MSRGVEQKKVIPWELTFSSWVPTRRKIELLQSRINLLRTYVHGRKHGEVRGLIGDEIHTLQTYITDLELKVKNGQG